MWQVVGQSKLVSMFQRSLAQGSLAHAYLLVGPAHVGKMTLALELAKTLNCKSASSPCGECESCRRIAQGKHSDVQVISMSPGQGEDDRSKTEIGVQQVSDTLHTANLPPFEGEFRVYIFEEAERMSNAAFNRILKTLEEPQAKVIFILLSSSDKLLPATIVSRCQRLELSRLKTDEVEAALAHQGVETEKARLLSRLSRGCLGWAMTCIRDPGLLQTRHDNMGKLIDMVHDDYSGRFELAGQMATQFSRKRETVYDTLESWLGWWRDILLVKTGCRDSVVNIDFLPTLVEMADSFSLAQIKEIAVALQSAAGQLRLNANQRLVLDVLMLSIPKIGDKKLQATQSAAS